MFGMIVLGVMASVVSSQSRSTLPVAPGIYSIQPVQSLSECLSMDAEEPTQNVRLTVSPCAEREGQEWAVSASPLKKGYVLLDYAGESRWYWTPGTEELSNALVLGVKKFGRLQLWRLEDAGNEQIRIRTGEKQCLTVDRRKVAKGLSIQPCSDAVESTQLWKFRLLDRSRFHD